MTAPRRAHIVHIITQLELGGAQLQTLHVLKHLPRDKFRVTLITGEPDQLDADAQAIDGLQYYSVPSLVREITPQKDIAAFWKLRRLLIHIRRDTQDSLIVHTNSSKAGVVGRWAARTAGIRTLVHSYHGFGFTPEQSRPLRTALMAAEILSRPITTVFLAGSISNLDRGARAHVLDPRRAFLIRSGFDMSEYSRGKTRPDRMRSELRVDASTPLVGMVACFKPQKAPVDFIDAAARIHQACPDARFVLVGDGELRPDVERAIDAHGLRDVVTLLGWRRDLPDILAALDVSVLTSRWEGLPRVVPHSLALGVPVVATAVDGTPEAILDGKTGFVVPPGDMNTLADRVINLLEDRALYQRMAAAGPAHIAAWDAQTMVDAHVTLYSALADGHLPPPDALQPASALLTR